MEAAAHTSGGYDGVPQSVGAEFVKKDDVNCLTELDIARKLSVNDLTSPQKFENMWLFDLRITGTGMSHRDNPKEYVYRDPAHFLTEDFVERCNGLPVIFEHPNGSMLNTEQFRERSVGTIILPYLKGDEVRGVARILDEDAATLMQSTHISTSPAVIFRDPESILQTEIDGEKIVVEGTPSYIDHLAICEHGVWDKGDGPTGVAQGDNQMPKEEEEKKNQEEEKVRRDSLPEEERVAEDKAKKDSEGEEGGTIAAILSKVLERLDKVDSRMDEIAGKGAAKEPTGELSLDKKAKKDCEGDTKKDKVKKDSEEGEEAKKREEEENRLSEERKEKGKKESEKLDSVAKENAVLKAKLESMESRFQAFSKELSPTERDELASIQSRFDSTYQMLGEHMSAPLPAETPISYRKRLASKIQKHSERFKTTRLDSLDSSVLDEVERNILEDANKLARQPSSALPGRLIAIRKADSTGRIITTYSGDPGVWMEPFRSKGFTCKINNDLAKGRK